jgi:hypothetical protein
LKKIFVLVLVLLIFASVVTGCSQPVEESTGNKTPQSSSGSNSNPEKPDSIDLQTGQSSESLGGIRLGMGVEELDKLLGDDFTENPLEEGGYFGESVIMRHYQNGCNIVIGQTTGEVLQIDVSSPEYPTEMGVKVGAPALEALEKYREKYSEFVGNQSPDKLVGWFETEPGTLLIFSCKENGERFNENLTEESKIHGITLGRVKFFD